MREVLKKVKCLSFQSALLGESGGLQEKKKLLILRPRMNNVGNCPIV